VKSNKLQLGDELSRLTALAACLLLIAFAGCERSNHRRAAILAVSTPTPTPPVVRPLPADAAPQLKQFLESAVAQSEITTGYDPSYVKIDYPNGDVSSDTGVCSDVVVRAFRNVGVDLQKEVHEDMQRAWADYPRRWGARGTDTNIDHRRVLNLMKYFERQGKSQPLTDDRADYKPGDVVAWQLSEGVEHIGIVTNLSSQPDKHYLIVHNIGGGVRVEDGLLSWKIIGHYRYF
jgi:uncharacterized protein YijF (DUF1287 family)